MLPGGVTVFSNVHQITCSSSSCLSHQLVSIHSDTSSLRRSVNKCCLLPSSVTQMMDLWRFPVLSDCRSKFSRLCCQKQVMTQLIAPLKVQTESCSSVIVHTDAASFVCRGTKVILCTLLCFLWNGAESVTATKNQTDQRQQETQLMLCSSPPTTGTAVTHQGCGNWTRGGFLWCLCAGIWCCGCRCSVRSVKGWKLGSVFSVVLLTVLLPL